ncbi:putative transcription factor [Golovinomyces cichoracearum]|uniref:Putative transcription factor n=1 Tax=Golovinomyces cichoracearum TaxID=62708 RepID=A0A420HU52_9PEZI|nr:putative transcription factor [Golovinomyces cichoracearum]
MANVSVQPPSKHSEKSPCLMPIGLREASFDSPTFRATAIHFSEQVSIIEKWLGAYTKTISRLISDITSLEDTFNSVMLRSVPPTAVSEAIIDHDYTLLAMKRFGESSRDWWSQMIQSMKKMESNVVEPVKLFLTGELRAIKDARRNLEQTQKIFDQTLSRYVGQSKTKVPSSLREDAFQVHETPSLDFCILVPHFRFAIDKLLIRISFDQWREMQRSCENSISSFTRTSGEMDRIKGWNKEIEASEAVFRRELLFARREIAEMASETSKPSREIEDYNLSTVAFLGSRIPSTPDTKSPLKESQKSERQGWLFLRINTGKPTRTSWVRRWFYLKAGVFGWFTQGTQAGAVEESIRFGVLLCNVKPAVQEDRRFCFEVKTKNQAVLVQAETQNQLMNWLDAFEWAKKTTLLANSDSPNLDLSNSAQQTSDIGIKAIDSHVGHANDELIAHMSDRVFTVPAPGIDVTNHPRGIAIDVNSQRRAFTSREEGESSRDHATRIMQRLDPTRKPVFSTNEQPSLNPSMATGGIASLITASHNFLPVITNQTEFKKFTLAPATLVMAPTPTSLSKKVIFMNEDRSNRTTGELDNGIPSVITANFWGSSNWGYINYFEKGEAKFNRAKLDSYSNTNSKNDQPPFNPRNDENLKPHTKHESSSELSCSSNMYDVGCEVSANSSQDKVRSQENKLISSELLPSNYPIELRAHDAQFRTLFPGMSRFDKVLLVFRAIWNPNQQQEFPGRVYVTQRDIFFYSHHLGLVLITSISMSRITEVTAAPGKDCDFIFLHIRENSTEILSRITIKTFLEPLRLLKARLTYLIDNSQSKNSLNCEKIISNLIRMEIKNDPSKKASWESFEDLSINTPLDTSAEYTHIFRDNLGSYQIERLPITENDKKVPAQIHLPSQPVNYEMLDVQQKVIEHQFNISSKALFHVLFGDKSIIFQKFYHQRKAERIIPGPWLPIDQGRMRREFKFEISEFDWFRQSQYTCITDDQTIEVKNDYLCYVASLNNKFWHLPYYSDFMLNFKIVITYVAKSKCNLAIYTKVDWSREPKLFMSLVERQALHDASLLAQKFTKEIMNEVKRLGPHSNTKNLLKIFGQVGQQSSVSSIYTENSGPTCYINIKQRTMVGLLAQVLRNFGEFAITSIVFSLISAIRCIRSVASAHRIILLALLLSLLTNTLLTYKDTSNWWTERKAIKFMNRMGVGPNQLISKAIYIKDLDDALTSIPTEISGKNGGKCYNQFKWISNVTDMDSPHHLAGITFLDTSTKSTARRLRRSRQQLGSYRHNILIAMRLVNQIEKGLIKAEWDNWLFDENIRCKKISSLLREDAKASEENRRKIFADLSKFSAGEAWQKSEKIEDLRRWKEVYCDDCALEQELSARRRKHSSYD